MNRTQDKEGRRRVPTRPTWGGVGRLVAGGRVAPHAPDVGGGRGGGLYCMGNGHLVFARVDDGADRLFHGAPLSNHLTSSGSDASGPPIPIAVLLLLGGGITVPANTHSGATPR